MSGGGEGCSTYQWISYIHRFSFGVSEFAQICFNRSAYISHRLFVSRDPPWTTSFSLALLFVVWGASPHNCFIIGKRSNLEFVPMCFLGLKLPYLKIRLSLIASEVLLRDSKAMWSFKHKLALAYAFETGKSFFMKARGTSDQLVKSQLDLYPISEAFSSRGTHSQLLLKWILYLCTRLSKGTSETSFKISIN